MKVGECLLVNRKNDRNSLTVIDGWLMWELKFDAFFNTKKYKKKLENSLSPSEKKIDFWEFMPIIMNTDLIRLVSLFSREYNSNNKGFPSPDRASFNTLTLYVLPWLCSQSSTVPLTMRKQTQIRSFSILVVLFYFFFITVSSDSLSVSGQWTSFVKITSNTRFKKPAVAV